MPSTAVATQPIDSAPVFARHESFHPRYGWLKKGFDLHEHLTEADAPVRLGVGKNMVSAIRYWSTAFKVLAEDRSSSGALQALRRSATGEQIFANEGLDPYMESPATLWLLHWRLLSRPCFATAWYFTFFHFNRSEFTADELVDALIAYKLSRYPRAKTTEGSIRKDVSCLLRMYGRHSLVGRALAEDSLDSPFAELGLLGTGAGSRQHAFNIGPKPTLPSEILAAACLEFMAGDAASCHARTISLGRLLDEEGAPGRAFKLSEFALCEALEEAGRDHGFVHLSETAGVLQLAVEGEAPVRARELISAAYRLEARA